MVPTSLPDAETPRRDRLICYSRPVCPLCDEASPKLVRVAAEFGLEPEWRNVEDRGDWEARYGTQVPVAFLGDVKLFKYRVTESELRQRIARLLGA